MMLPGMYGLCDCASGGCLRTCLKMQDDGEDGEDDEG